jgi:hypothetical protein
MDPIVSLFWTPGYLASYLHCSARFLWLADALAITRLSCAVPHPHPPEVRSSAVAGPSLIPPRRGRDRRRWQEVRDAQQGRPSSSAPQPSPTQGGRRQSLRGQDAIASTGASSLSRRRRREAWVTQPVGRRWALRGREAHNRGTRRCRALRSRGRPPVTP